MFSDATFGRKTEDLTGLISFLQRLSASELQEPVELKSENDKKYFSTTKHERNFTLFVFLVETFEQTVECVKIWIYRYFIKHYRRNS